MKDLFYKNDWCLSYDDVLIVPQYSQVLPPEVDTSVQLTQKIKLQIPILSSAMDKVTEHKLAIRLAELGGLGVIHKNCPIDYQVKEVSKVKEKNLIVGAALGVSEKDIRRLEELIKVGVDLVVIDTAHGHSLRVAEMVKTVKRNHPNLDVIAGNVATVEACEFLAKSGVDGIKIGIGPGSICTTRIVAGIGIPQFQALLDCRNFCLENKIPFIADGGIKNSGDIAKALATGASSVMLGSLLASTHEAPGELIEVDGKFFKIYRGMGSVGAMNQGSKERYGQDNIASSKKLVAEGVEGKVPYKGELDEVVYQLVGGLRASMGYVGAGNLIEFRDKAKFIKMTGSSMLESKPHNIL